MSSPVHTLLAEVAGFGARLYARGGRITARPCGRLPPELRERIAARKAELLELLATRPAAAATPLPVESSPQPPAEQDSPRSERPPPAGGGTSASVTARTTARPASAPGMDAAPRPPSAPGIPAQPAGDREDAPPGPGCRRCGQPAKVLTAPRGWCVACAMRAQARDDQRRAEEAERRGETPAERCLREAREYRDRTERRWQAIRRGEWPEDCGPGGGEELTS